MEKTLTAAEIKAMQKELLEILLKRANLTKNDIYKRAEKSFVNGNLDLLTKKELEKYKNRVIL